MNIIRSSIAGAFALGLLAAAPASAETDPAAAPAGGGAPSQPLTPNETKTYGDWTVRCYPIKGPSPCDMYELLANKQNQQRIMSVSIAYMPNGDKHVMQIAVPLGVAIPKGLVVETDAYTSPALRYRRCDRSGCYVELIIPPEMITGLSTATTGKVKIVADGGKAYDIPFSVNGFADAHGAMQDLARKKTATAAAPAPAPAAPADGGTTAPAPITTPDLTPTPTPTP